MCDDRYMAILDSFRKVHDGVGVETVDHTAIGSICERERAAGMGIEFPPFLTAVATGYEEVHSLFPSLVAQIIVGAEGIEFGRIHPFERLREGLHGRNITPQLIPQGHHHKRGVMTVGSDDTCPLLHEEVH